MFDHNLDHQIVVILSLGACFTVFMLKNLQGLYRKAFFYHCVPLCPCLEVMVLEGLF